MPRKSDSGRVILDERAKESLDKMLEILKMVDSFLKINPSRLSSWIVHRYFMESFEKEKQTIARDHFNPKGYLKNALKGIESEEDITNALKTILSKVKPQAESRKNKKRISSTPKPETVLVDTQK